MTMIQFGTMARLDSKNVSTPLGPALTSGHPIDGAGGKSEVTLSARGAIVLIEPRTLIRDCLRKCLEASVPGEVVHAFTSVADWADAWTPRAVAPIILLSTADCDETDFEREIADLFHVEPMASIVLLSDDADCTHVLGALDRGVRGYISTSMPFDVAVTALQLVRAGGTFVPAESLRASKFSGSEAQSPAKHEGQGAFTSRQLAVIEALRQGKANKIIAFELNMRESTVKVHVRNIMKKLQAKNRTEVAYRINAMTAAGRGLVAGA